MNILLFLSSLSLLTVTRSYVHFFLVSVLIREVSLPLYLFLDPFSSVRSLSLCPITSFLSSLLFLLVQDLNSEQLPDSRKLLFWYFLAIPQKVSLERPPRQFLNTNWKRKTDKVILSLENHLKSCSNFLNMLWWRSLELRLKWQRSTFLSKLQSAFTEFPLQTYWNPNVLGADTINEDKSY